MTESIFKTAEGKKKLLDFYDRMIAASGLDIDETDVETSAGTTHVLSYGKADLPPLVLLHGSTSNAATWISDFTVYAREFHVHAIDMPGEPGKSAETRMSWKNNEYPDWLLQVLNALGLEKPSFVGLSLGGWVALKFASEYPKRTGNVALIAPGGIATPNMGAIFKLVRYQKEGQSGVEKTLKMLFPDDFDSPEVIEFFSLINSNFNTRVEAVPRLDDETISKIRSHVYMLCGAKDVLFNFKKAARRLLKLLPKAEVQLYEKGTHGLVNMAEATLPFLLR